MSNMSPYDGRFIHPSTFILAGPSGENYFHFFGILRVSESRFRYAQDSEEVEWIKLDLRMKFNFNLRFGFWKSVQGCGKTTLASRLIIHTDVLFKDPPKNTYIFGSNRQPIYDHLVNIGAVTKIFNELPQYDDLKKLLYPHKDGAGSLIVIDDCLQGDTWYLFNVICEFYSLICTFHFFRFVESYSKNFYWALSLYESHMSAIITKPIFSRSHIQKPVTE